LSLKNTLQAGNSIAPINNATTEINLSVIFFLFVIPMGQ